MMPGKMEDCEDDDENQIDSGMSLLHGPFWHSKPSENLGLFGGCPMTMCPPPSILSRDKASKPERVE